MSLQLNIFLLLFGGLQGLLFSLFLTRKKLHNSAYIFLLLYLGIMLLQITLKVMSKVWLMGNWSLLYTFSHYLPVLYGPLLYLFVKHLLQKQSFRFKDSLHFLPAVFLFGIIIIAKIYALPAAFDFIFFHPVSRFVFLLASVFVYHWMAYQTLEKHLQNMQHLFSGTTALQMNWVKEWLIISVITCTAVVSALFLLYINYPAGHQYRYGFAALSICIYWFSYTALTKPSVFSVIKWHAWQNADNDYPLPQLKVYKPVNKYANSALRYEDAGQICGGLEKLMTEKKLFLQPDLTINQLADALHCSRHHLSQVLNDNLRQSYYDYINYLRVEEAKRLLNDANGQQYKIASIAYDSGFNSLSTFNDVFKKKTGKTPSDYRKEIVKELQTQRV